MRSVRQAVATAADLIRFENRGTDKPEISAGHQHRASARAQPAVARKMDGNCRPRGLLGLISSPAGRAPAHNHQLSHIIGYGTAPAGRARYITARRNGQVGNVSRKGRRQGGKAKAGRRRISGKFRDALEALHPITKEAHHQQKPRCGFIESLKKPTRSTNGRAFPEHSVSLRFERATIGSTTEPTFTK